MMARLRIFCLIFCTGVAPAAAAPGGNAALRATLSAALGIPMPEGPVKCGFPLVTRAMHAPPSPAIAQLLLRTERQKRKTSGHFTVHYDTSGADAAALLDASLQPIAGSADRYADSILAIARDVWAFEVDSLGFLHPPSDTGAGGGPEYDIYVADLGSEYGETVPEDQLDAHQDGNRFTSYLLIDNDFIFVTPVSERGLPAARVTIAHEFFHAVQIGSYGYWTAETYFYELSSVWMETMAYPGIPDYLSYLNSSQGMFRNPSTTFTSNEPIYYSRFLWGTFLTARFGAGTMREVWEAIASAEPLAATTSALHAHGSSFREAFAEWTVWNCFTGVRAQPGRYYPLASTYPAMVTSPAMLSSGVSSEDIGGTLQPLSARYYEVTVPASVVYAIVANIDDASALTTVTLQLPYTLHLSLSQPGPSYVAMGGGLFGMLEAATPSLWALNGTSLGGIPDEGGAFPNPFLADGSATIALVGRQNNGSADPAVVRIYDASMRLIYDAQVTLTAFKGRSIYRWNGISGGKGPAASGVYFYTLKTAAGTTTGKFALVRK